MIELLKNWSVGKAVPAISLRQPWASAVADYGKDVENRSRWPFKHRGPLIIHASSTRPYLEDFEQFVELAKKGGYADDDLGEIKDGSYPTDVYPHGCIVGIANLVDVFSQAKPPPAGHPVNASVWKIPDAGCWLYLTDVVSVQEISWKGFVGLFTVPYDIASALEPLPIADG